jgi:hypothetical protein
VKSVRLFQSHKPGCSARWLILLFLAESGAVEPSHTGPFKLYKKDDAGIILHDVIFAPFFAGSAGTGQCWHWDQYVEDKGIWFQFRQFAEAIRGVNPLIEQFRPIEFETARVRAYALQGQHSLLIWCRDKQNTWQSELAQGLLPQPVQRASLDLPVSTLTKQAVRFYDPWTDTSTECELSGSRTLQLPDFKRSLLIRVK